MIDDIEQPLIQLIESIRRETKLDQKISDSLLLIEIIEKTDAEEKELEELKAYLKERDEDPGFRRTIRRFNTIMASQEDALLYYGHDYSGDPDYEFSAELEAQFVEVEGKVRKLLAIAMKKIISSEIIINE